MLENDYPGRIFAVIPVGDQLDIPPRAAAGPDPDYRKFDRALKTSPAQYWYRSSVCHFETSELRSSGQYLTAAALADAGAAFREVP
jgi:hypothetical protein